MQKHLFNYTLTALLYIYSTVAVVSQTWDNDGGNFLWNTGTNWSGNAVPGGSANVIFGNVGVGSINVDTTPTLQSMTFNATAGAYTFNGSTITINNAGFISNASSQIQTFNNNITRSGQLKIAGSGETRFTGTSSGGGQLTFFNSGFLNIAGGALNNGANEIRMSDNTTIMVSSGGGLTNTGATYLGISTDLSSGPSNRIIVTGPNSIFRSSTIYLGWEAAGSRNSLIVSNGGTLEMSGANLHVGQTAGSTGNMVLVTGSGSRITNFADLYLGLGGAQNRFFISNGGIVLNSGGGYVGYSSHSNSSIISGAGSSWQMGGQLRVDFGNQNSNSLLISDSGRVVAGSTLYVGQGGSSNLLRVISGGTLSNASGFYIGNGAGTSNTLEVSGAGSRYDVTGTDSRVGNGGSFGLLLITNGGVVNMTGGGNFYTSVGGSSNNIFVAGSGSQLNYDGTLNLAWSGTSRMTISNGGAVTVRTLSVGAQGVIDHFGGNFIVTNGGTTYNGGVYTAGNGSAAAGLGLFGGTHSFNSTLVINTNAVLAGSGTIDVNTGGGGSSTITNRGLLRPGTNMMGEGYGTMTFQDNLWIGPTATSLFSIGGTTSGLFDSNRVNGTLTAGGVLDLFFDYDTFANTDTWTIFQNNALGGSFTSTNFLGGALGGTVLFSGNNIIVSNVTGASWVWDGGGGNGGLETAANWVGDTTPVNDGRARLIFAQNNTRPNPVANVAWDVRGITFSNAGTLSVSYGLRGSNITVRAAGIDNNSSLDHNITNNIILAASQGWELTNGGNLSFFGTVDTGPGASNYQWTVDTASGRLLRLTGNVSGGATLIKNGAGNILLEGANNALGGVTLNAGALLLGNNDVLHVTNSTGSAVFNIVGTNFSVASNAVINVDRLLATNSAVTVLFDQGILTTRTSTISSGHTSDGGVLGVGRVAGQQAQWVMNGGDNYLVSDMYLGRVANSTGIVTVTGASTVFTNNTILVGSNSAGNIYQVFNGAKVTNRVIAVGQTAAASNNSIIVSGAGSTLVSADGSAGQAMILGFYGSSNSITVSNGGLFVAQGDIRVGISNASVNNLILVTGSGSELRLGAAMRIGFNTNSHNNSVIVEGGGKILSENTIILGQGGSTNLFRVSGAGSVVTSSLSFIVGNDGFTAATSTHNTAIVSNSGVMNLALNLFVGSALGGSNQLIINSGARVTNNGGTWIGSSTVGNTGIVSGVGTHWETLGEVMLGANTGSSNNIFTVTNGATHRAGNVMILGQGGGSNSFIVSGGGKSTNSLGLTIGHGTANNTVVVRDAGSLLDVFQSIGSSIVLGSTVASTGNTLFVTNGGRLNSLSVGTSIIIGNSANNNRVVVDGSGSIFSNAGIFLIGPNGNTGNRIDISNGGSVYGNGLQVTAGNSIQHAGGTLEISSGGTAYNGGAYSAGNGVQTASIGFIGGTHTFNNSLTINTNSQIYGTGTVDVGAGAITNRGTLNPGTSGVIGGADIGTLTFNDALVLTATSTSLFNFASLASFDRVVINGANTVTAGGVLNLTFDYTPGLTDGFIIFQTGAAPLGSWSQINWLGSVTGGTVTNIGNNIIVTNLFMGGPIWDGGGGNNDWGTAANWVGDVTPANDGTVDIVFAASPNARTNANVNTAWNLRTLTFSNTVTTNYHLTGQTITVQGSGGTGIVQNSTRTQTINNAVNLGSSQTWYAAGGQLNLAGVVNVSNRVMTLTGASNFVFSGNGQLQLTNGGAVYQTGAGQLVLNGNGGGTGVIRHRGGTSTLTGAVSLAGNSLIRSEGGTFNYGAGTLAVGGNTLTVDGAGTVAVQSGAGVTLNGGNIFLQGGGFQIAGNGTGNGVIRNLGGTSTITGNVALTAASTLGVDAGTLNITNGAWTGNQVLSKSGGGTLSLNNGTSYQLAGLNLQGGTTVANTGANVFVTNGGGTATLLATNSSTFTVSGASVRADRIVVTNGAGWNFNHGTVTSSATIYSNSSTFVVGNGSQAATLTMQGGTHSFQNAVVLTNQSRLNLNTGSRFVASSLSVSNGAIFDVTGTVTNTGNVNFGTGAVVSNLVAGDIFRVEGNLTNRASIGINTAGGASVPTFNGIELTGSFSNLGTMTFNFNAPLTTTVGTYSNPYLFGIRSSTDIFDPYYSGSLGTGPGSWLSSFSFVGWGGNTDGSENAQGQYITYIYSGSYYYLAVIPEPSTWALIILSFGCAILWIIRKQILSYKKKTG